MNRQRFEEDFINKYNNIYFKLMSLNNETNCRCTMYQPNITIKSINHPKYIIFGTMYGFFKLENVQKIPIEQLFDNYKSITMDYIFRVFRKKKHYKEYKFYNENERAIEILEKTS